MLRHPKSPSPVPHLGYQIAGSRWVALSLWQRQHSVQLHPWPLDAGAPLVQPALVLEPPLGQPRSILAAALDGCREHLLVGTSDGLLAWWEVAAQEGSGLTASSGWFVRVADSHVRLHLLEPATKGTLTGREAGRHVLAVARTAVVLRAAWHGVSGGK